MAENSHSGTAPPVRGGALDLLRFLASFFIVVYHYGSDAPFDLVKIHPVFLRGHLATDFFLLLSGYVLGRAYGPRLREGRITAFNFWLRRVVRVWPCHLIVLAALAALVLASGFVGLRPSHPEWFDWRQLPGQILLIQAWGPFGGDGWNLPSWSLSALIICYAAFPALWRLMARVRSATALVVGSIILLLAMDALCRALYGRGVYDLPFHLGVVRAAPFFILGASLARAVAEQGPTPLRRWLARLAVLAFVVIQALGRYDLASILAIAVVVGCAEALPRGRFSRLSAWGANLSYSIFVTHVLAGTIWFGLAHHFLKRAPAPVAWGLWFAGLGFALAFAAGFERLVDRPLQAWIRPRLAASLGSLAAGPIATHDRMSRPRRSTRWQALGESNPSSQNENLVS